MSEPPSLVFVGGTGRSGTHVVAHLLGQQPSLAMVPIETRFHCNPSGLADVVTGKASPQQFLTKLRGFWWQRRRVGARALVGIRGRAARGGRERGLHKIVSRERFREAAARFEADHGDDLVGASRNLFFDLLGPIAEEAGKPGLIEMSCFTIASAPGLAQIFPEARFVHAVRDGRDSGSSKASKRQKPHHPTGVLDGIDWWLDRLRHAEAGVRGLPDRERLTVVSLDELVAGDREGTYRALLDGLGLDDDPAARRFFDEEMSAGAAHRQRWREGLDERGEEEVRRRYEDALETLEREGYHCAEVLRRSYSREAETPA